MWRSLPQIPQARTRTTTSPGPGSGISTSWNATALGPPYVAARTIASPYIYCLESAGIYPYSMRDSIYHGRVTNAITPLTSEALLEHARTVARADEQRHGLGTTGVPPNHHSDETLRGWGNAA